MKRYLAIYTGTPQALEQYNKLDEATRKQREKEGFNAWMQWGERHAAAIVDQGSPVGATKRASKQGVQDIRNNVAGYVVVQAESHEAAAKLFENHPHFALFPGDAVEIMELVPIPAR